MEYYKDLTYYSLHHFENAINIGWINDCNPFTQGTVDKIFLKNLEEYIKTPFNTIRGYLKCDICGCDTYNISISNQKVNLGYSEIRVISQDGKQKFAAPDMIYHYITNHNYLPPINFIEAVITGPKPNSKKYQKFNERYNEEFIWGEKDETIKIAMQIENYIKTDVALAKRLILSNPDFKNFITKNGSFLNIAIKENNLKMVNFLIDTGIDINKFNGKELYSAITLSDTTILEFLLSKKIEIDLTSWSNPLFKAISIGNKKAVETLINHGVNFQIEYSNPYVKNMDAIKFARYCKQEQTSKLIEKYLN